MIANINFDLLAADLVNKFDIKKIFLFGSYAQGKADKNSDIDLCIVANLGNKRKIELIRELRKEIYSQLNLPLDILVYEEQEFNLRANLLNTLEYKILKDGRLLNG